MDAQVSRCWCVSQSLRSAGQMHVGALKTMFHALLGKISVPYMYFTVSTVTTFSGGVKRTHLCRYTERALRPKEDTVSPSVFGAENTGTNGARAVCSPCTSAPTTRGQDANGDQTRLLPGERDTAHHGGVEVALCTATCLLRLCPHSYSRSRSSPSDLRP
jgi:hypothetical protein